MSASPGLEVFMGFECVDFSGEFFAQFKISVGFECVDFLCKNLIGFFYRFGGFYGC
jgi:hypothetical protein